MNGQEYLKATISYPHLYFKFFNLEYNKVVQISNINIECYGDFICGTTIKEIIS